MYKTLSAIILCFLFFSASAQRATDTFRLYFDLNVAKLSAPIQKKIDLLVYNDRIINGSNIQIIGYADYLGSEGYNKDLSMRRAKNVKEYLVEYGINAEDIKVCLGKGEVTRTGIRRSADGYPTDRRVDIVVNNRIRKPPLATKRHDTGRKVITSNIDDIKYLKPGSTLALKNLYFIHDRHVILPESKETLEKLYDVLKQYPHLKISIEGHVCCINAKEAADAVDIDTYEPVLSYNRAKAVYLYLVSKGIDSTRLKYVGFGHSRPVVAEERTEEDAEKNRRVEIRVLENK